MMKSLFRQRHWSGYAREPAQRQRWLAELGELLAIPSVSALPTHRRDLDAAAAWLARHLAQLGLGRAHVRRSNDGGAPGVYAEWRGAPGRPTVLLCGHYDVQPVGPLDAWQTPPFRATIVGDHLVARGASDDKGQLFTHLKALESHLATTGRLPVNVKVWLEGDEEIGSPGLRALLDREGELLRADAAVISDTRMLGLGQPALVHGLRGVLGGTLDVRGPARDLHAGRYGGAVLSPPQALSGIIAGLHDQHGRVAIPGFYQRVRQPEPGERHQLGQHTPSDRELRARLGVPGLSGEAGWSSAERMTVRPALIVQRLAAGSAAGVIPSRASARLSVLLVPDQKPAEIAQLLRRRIAALTPPAVHTRLTTTAGSRPVLLPRQHPALCAAARAVQQVWQVPVALTRSGGSIPLVAELWHRMRMPTVLLGFGLPGDGAHAPGERLHLPTFFRGIETMIRFLEEYGA